jgi:hypothetical protein
VAALVLLSPAEPDLSLSPHQLDAAPSPHLVNDSTIVHEAPPEPLMMAQPVPHQATDKRRVKVYELRHNDWFDRGTGFCHACLVPVCLSRRIASAQPWSLHLDFADHVMSLIHRPKKASRKIRA